MKLVIFVLVVLALAVGYTQFAMNDPGYVLISRAPWTIEGSLAVFIPLLLLAFLALYFVLRLISGLLRSPAAVGRWRRRQRRDHARRAQSRGLVKLVERNSEEAERALLDGLEHCDAPLVSYLALAAAAQEAGEKEKRDGYLARAHKVAPRETLAIGLVQAELQHAANQSEQALATLAQLHGAIPKNVHVLSRLTRTYRELRDWESLADLLPELRKRHVLDDDELHTLGLEIYREILTRNGKDKDNVTRAWNEIVPKSLRREPALVAAYARRLIELGSGADCESVLRGAIAHKWDADLVYLYGLLGGAGDSADRLKTAESWLRAHPHSPTALLTAGRLAMENQIWGNARGYLEAAIANGGTAEAYLELGQLVDQLGDADRALEHYRKGLELAARQQLPTGVSLKHYKISRKTGVAATQH
jgi:HemY protein